MSTTTSKLTWEGDTIKALIRKASLAARLTIAEAVLTEAAPNTPHDTGTLRRSATISIGGLPDATKMFAEAQGGTNLNVAIEKAGSENAVYVSWNTPYAHYQHELGAAKPGNKRGPDGGPKFAQNAWEKLAPAAIKYHKEFVTNAVLTGKVPSSNGIT